VLKLSCPLATLMLVLAWSRVPFSLFILAAMTMGILILGGLDAGRLAHMAAAPFGFALLGSLAIAFRLSGQPGGWMAIGLPGAYLCVDAVSLSLAISVLSKSLAGISCMLFIIATTPLEQVMGVLMAAKAPAILTEVMMLTARFIYVLIDMARSMSVAQASRLGNIGLRNRLASVSALASSVFVRSFTRTEDIQRAMESRGYDGTIAYTQPVSKVTAGQLACVASYAAALAAAMALTALA
jgi:cobalt/nickel transport system permease protein